MADNPILQDSQRPFSLRYPSSLSSKQRQAIYQGQVRAFLEASEIVEMEEDVLDDILDGFDGFDRDASDCVSEEQSFIPVRQSERDTAGNIELPLPYGFYVYFGPQGMATRSSIGYRLMLIYRTNACVLTRRPHGSSLDETTN
jgi:hypothetical protein